MADIFDPLPWLIMLPLAVYARGHFATVKESAPFWPIAVYLLAAVNALLPPFGQLPMPEPSVLPARAARHPAGLEARLRAWPLAGLLWLLLFGGLLVLLAIY